MINNVKFSVVIPTYHNEETISETIKSLVLQTYPPLEIIIIDSSKDNYVKSIVDSHNDIKIKYYFLNKLGISNALNYGCSKADGNYIARLDADDIAFPDWLNKAQEYILKNIDVSVFSFGYYPFTKNISEAGDLVIHSSSHELIMASLLFCSPICHPGAIIKKEIFKNYQYKNCNAEDHDLWCRISKKFKFGNIEEGLIYYRKSAKSLSSKKGKILSLSTYLNGFFLFLKSPFYFIKIYNLLSEDDLTLYKSLPKNKIMVLKKIFQFLPLK